MNLSLRLRTLTAVAVLALSPLAAFAGDTAKDDASKTSPEVSIPFANRGGIKDWQADADRGLWIQDVHNKWYYAKLLNTCTGLNFANSIGFDTRPSGTFDRFSYIVVPRDGRCAVQTFAASGAPPRKGKDNRPPNGIETAMPDKPTPAPPAKP